MVKFKAKIISRVTVPVLKMKPNKEYYIRFDEAIHEGEKLEKQKFDNNAMVCKVTLLNTDTLEREVNLMICRTVMVKEINRNYPADSYIGKWFSVAFQNHPDPAVKYKLFTISEIAEPTAEDFAPIDEETGEIGEPEDDFTDPESEALTDEYDDTQASSEPEEKPKKRSRK